MKIFSNQKFLAVYSGILTLIVCVTFLTGFSSHRGAWFDTITVQRINVVEPDGTLRMVLTNNRRIPGIIMHGNEYPDFTNRKGSTTAGIFFYDGEGSESGGLTFGGGTGEQREVSRFGHLSFDGYEQDQLFAIDVQDDGTNHRSTMTYFDIPDWSIVDYLDLLESIRDLPEDEQAAAIAEFFETHPTDDAGPRTQLTNFNAPSQPALNVNHLLFNDRTGRTRLAAGLDDMDEPSINLFDESGNSLYRIPPN